MSSPIRVPRPLVRCAHDGSWWCLRRQEAVRQRNGADWGPTELQDPQRPSQSPSTPDAASALCQTQHLHQEHEETNASPHLFEQLLCRLDLFLACQEDQDVAWGLRACSSSTTERRAVRIHVTEEKKRQAPSACTKCQSGAGPQHHDCSAPWPTTLSLPVPLPSWHKQAECLTCVAWICSTVTTAASM